MNKELRLLQIQVLELQLIGMMKRRGLSRNEQKRMKALQIEQAKLRLKNIKETKTETAIMYTDYLDRKKILDDYVTSLEDNTYQLKYSYDQQVIDLQITIDYEAGLLAKRKTQWEDVTNEIATLGEGLSARLKAILSDESLVAAFDNIDINILEIRDNMQDLLTDVSELTAETWPTETGGGGGGGTTIITSEPDPATATERGTAFIQSIIDSPLAEATEGRTQITNFLKRITGLQRGSEYVHETGLRLIHQGETIGAAGKDHGDGGIIIENVTIEVAQIADIEDVEKVGAMLSMAANSNVLDKKGKTRYRLV